MQYNKDLILAPMAGFSDSAFRQICLTAGAKSVTTEMVSVKGLVYQSNGTKDLLFSNGYHKQTIVQLFGNEPEFFAQAIAMLEQYDFAGYDINMGCPVPKVVKIGAGSALLNDMPLASKIISTCVYSTHKPVSVKMRLGWDSNSIVGVDFAKMCVDSGASSICVHGRTREQMYSGEADWQSILEIANNVNISVVGNGDIVNAEQARQILDDTKLSAVVVARGALGNPWIFADFYGTDFRRSALDTIKQHYTLMMQYCPPEHVVPIMRGHLNYYLKRQKINTKSRVLLNQMTDIQQIFDFLEEIL